MKKRQESVESRKFPALLKRILNRHGIRNAELAEVLGVTSQYVSKFLCGISMPNRVQMNKILEYLTVRHVPIDLHRQLISGYVEDKTGFFYEIADLEFSAKDQWEKKLLTDFRLLTPDARKEVLGYISKILIDSL
ncbi:MAG TPA: helix-turn-helix transcriptional regulator [Lentisphaeria bacterium]|nr:helix-turn-helix transcriptional regulator [Lentisphaeria bacterium]